MKKLAIICWISLGAFVAGTAIAQAPLVTPEPLECMNPDGQAVMYATIDPPPAEDDEVRLFFRRAGFGDFYYVIMEMIEDEIPVRYRSVLPVPEPDNELSQAYIAVIGPDGRVRSRSQTVDIPITDDCDFEQDEGAEHIVGETSLAQKDRKIAWWQCEDVTARIDVYGEQRDEGACFPAIIWWQRPEVIVPVALGAVGTVVVVTDVLDDDPTPPVSPSTP